MGKRTTVVDHDSASTVIALVGATIIDGNGGTPIEDGVILADGGRISAVGDRSTIIPEHAQTIKVDGKFVIPGFVGDVWTMEWWYPITYLLYDGRYVEIAIEAAQIALVNGITTLIDWRSPRDEMIEARNLINSGQAIGARYYVGGNWLGFPAPSSGENYPWMKEALPASIHSRMNARWEGNVGPRLIALSPDELRDEIRQYIEPELDMLTIMATGNYGPAVNYLRFSPRQVEAIIDEAHRAGLPVHMHCMYSCEAIQIGLDAGADSFYFAPTMAVPKKTIKEFAKRKIVISRMLSLMDEEGMEDSANTLRTAPHLIDLHKGFPESYHNTERALREAGILRRFLAFTGAHWPSFSLEADGAGRSVRNFTKNLRPFVLGEEHFRTFVHAQKLGMEPMEILLEATRNAAMAKNFDQHVGTLERGKFADLVVLDHNPLEDAANYSSINLVMKEGKVVDREALLKAPRIFGDA